MLRLPPLRYTRAETVAAATTLLRDAGSRVIAGGTDLLPNLKLGSAKAVSVVSLADLSSLVGIRGLEDPVAAIEIGAATTLAVIARDPLVQATLPDLADAVGRIASPQIRNRATLAGNLCLDTRCRYINQSDLFREALGGCLKSHGVECHVVPGGQNCVAALSCDSAPILIALDAEVMLTGGAGGDRRLALNAFYNTNGLQHTALKPGELITAVRIPVPGAETWVTYRKWARRQSIDFPLVSVALRLELEPGGRTLRGGLLVIGALGPRPRLVRLGGLAGQQVDDALAAKIGALAVKRCKPLPNIPYDPVYRRRRIGVEAKRAAMALMSRSR